MKALLALCLASLLAACGAKSEDSKFIGTWVNLKLPTNTIQVVKNGDGYLLRNTIPNAGRGRATDPATISNSYPATLKDDALQTSDGIEQLSYVIDKSTGHLIANGREFQRISATANP